MAAFIANPPVRGKFRGHFVTLLAQTARRQEIFPAGDVYIRQSTSFNAEEDLYIPAKVVNSLEDWRAFLTKSAWRVSTFQLSYHQRRHQSPVSQSPWSAIPGSGQIKRKFRRRPCIWLTWFCLVGLGTATTGLHRAQPALTSTNTAVEMHGVTRRRGFRSTSEWRGIP